MTLIEQPDSARGLSAAISPAQHAAIDYGVAFAFLAAGATLFRGHRPASTLAFLNGAAILGMSMLTAYPGGLFRVLSFKGHRTGDIVQAIFTAAGPLMFGFSREPEAKYFYGQAMSEVGVIAATDWDGAV